MAADEPVAAVSATPRRRKYRSTNEIVTRILDAALAEFKKNGFDRSTTASIARRAEVVEPQIFRYFRSKSNLFRSAIFDTLNRQLDAISAEFHWEDDPRGARPSWTSQADYTQRLQQFLAENIDLIKSLFIANAYGAFDTPAIGVEDSLSRYFEHGAAIMQRNAPADAEVEPYLMVRISFGAVLGCVLFKGWLFPEGSRDNEEVAAAISKFVLAGLRATYGEDAEPAAAPPRRKPARKEPPADRT